MEWSKYVLSVMVGGCLLVLYGKRAPGGTSGSSEQEPGQA